MNNYNERFGRKQPAFTCKFWTKLKNIMLAYVPAEIQSEYSWIKVRNITTKMYWLLRRKSKVSTSNKFLIYKTIFKPIWTYGIQLWGTASTSNIEIQSKALRMIVNSRWFMPNTVIRRDLRTPTINQKIRRYSCQYSARLSAKPNDLLVNLMVKPDNRRLRRHLTNVLPTRFLV
jgi:hypothetical protein